MSDRQRVYSDEEFALILHKATELASNPEPGPASAGLTLTEMKAIAAQVGIDPSLVEQAARLLPADSSASRFERLIGGPLRHNCEVHLPVTLDESRAAELLSAVQIHAGQPGSGHSSSVGMVWHASPGELEALSVTAQPDEDGTSIAVQIDRTGILAMTQVGTVIGFVTAAAAGIFLGNEVAPALGVAAGVSGMGGILALVRGYWASSTREVLERTRTVTDAISQVISRPPGLPPAPAGVDEGSSARAEITEHPAETG